MIEAARRSVPEDSNRTGVRMPNTINNESGIRRIELTGKSHSLRIRASGLNTVAIIRLKAPSHGQPIRHALVKKAKRAARPRLRIVPDSRSKKNIAGRSTTWFVG